MRSRKHGGRVPDKKGQHNRSGDFGFGEKESLINLLESYCCPFIAGDGKESQPVKDINR